MSFSPDSPTHIDRHAPELGVVERSVMDWMRWWSTGHFDTPVDSAESLDHLHVTRLHSRALAQTLRQHPLGKKLMEDRRLDPADNRHVRPLIIGYIMQPDTLLGSQAHSVLHFGQALEDLSPYQINHSVRNPDAIDALRRSSPGIWRTAVQSESARAGSNIVAARGFVDTAVTLAALTAREVTTDLPETMKFDDLKAQHFAAAVRAAVSEIYIGETDHPIGALAMFPCRESKDKYLNLDELKKPIPQDESTRANVSRRVS